MPKFRVTHTAPNGAESSFTLQADDLPHAWSDLEPIIKHLDGEVKIVPDPDETEA